jgi:hypothetical protein
MDLQSGATRHAGFLPRPGGRVIGFRADGIYLAADLVYRMDPATGALKVIGPNGTDRSVAGGGFWFWVTSTEAWYSLLPVPNQGDLKSVLSLSLSDGKLRTWYTAPAQRAVSIVGFVGPSEPLVVEYGNDASRREMADLQFMLLTGPGSVKKVAFSASSAPSPWGITDAAGVWLSSGGHVWIYDQRGYEPMADVGDAIGHGVEPTPLGTCH